jgi:SAM-dependent methyltransferase
MYRADQDDYYYKVGLSALEGIMVAMSSAGKPPSDVREVLDFACGYGRVLRALRMAFPSAHTVAADLDQDAVDFCAATFGVTPVYGREPVSETRLAGQFDLVWVGSLFTHLDLPKWDGFFAFLEAALAPRGVLVFSVSGRYVGSRLESGYAPANYGLDAAGAALLLQGYRGKGFGYSDYPGGSGYGISVANPSAVVGYLAKRAGVRIVSYAEKAWVQHQDIVAVVKEPILIV